VDHLQARYRTVSKLFTFASENTQLTQASREPGWHGLCLNNSVTD
jgi:hypothetical protein